MFKNSKLHIELGLFKSLCPNSYPSQPRDVKRFLMTGLLVGFGLSLSPIIKAQAATPIVEYKFNGTGAIAFSSSCPSPSLALTLRTAAAGIPIDSHSANGGGVSGLSGDRSFNNTFAIRMGVGNNSDNAGRIANQADLSAVDNLSSFTLQGWFKTAPGQTLGSFARLFDNHSDKVSPQGGFEVYGGVNANGPTGPGKLSLLVNGSQASTTTAAFSEQNTWVFFAVTYNGTSKTNNVKFYKGTKTAPVKLVNTLTLAKGAMNSEPTGLSIGNRDRRPLDPTQVRDRPFDGFLDNMRIFGTKTGGGGVLSQSELEARRSRDVFNLP